MKALESLPTSLTKCQRDTLLRQVCAVQPSDTELDNICSLLSTFCSNAISIFGSESTLHVLAPPVQTCLKCSVAFHTCSTKHYSCNNAYNVKKYTRRCAKCNLLYNYSQYGDKHQQGFHYYSQPWTAGSWSNRHCDCILWQATTWVAVLFSVSFWTNVLLLTH